MAPAVYPSGRSQALYFPVPAGLASVAGGASGLFLDIKLDFSTARDESIAPGETPAVIHAYQYSLLDRNDTELLVYHWHPRATGPNVPHLHVSAALDAQVDARNRQTIDLDKRHLATGLVTLRSAVRMLITEFQIRPLRADWAERLADPDPH